MNTLDLEENVVVFEDVDDITVEQIYQFTCMLNKNYYDYELGTEMKEKVKNRLSKYMKSIFNQGNYAGQNLSQTQKLKAEFIKEK